MSTTFMDDFTQQPTPHPQPLYAPEMLARLSPGEAAISVSGFFVGFAVMFHALVLLVT